MINWIQLIYLFLRIFCKMENNRIQYNYQKMHNIKNREKMRKRKNHEISAEIMKLHELSPNFMKFC